MADAWYIHANEPRRLALHAIGDVGSDDVGQGAADQQGGARRAKRRNNKPAIQSDNRDGGLPSGTVIAGS